MQKKKGGKITMKEAGSKLYVLANRVVRMAGVGIFLFLTWYSMRYTQYVNPGMNEDPVNVPDSMLQNLLTILLVTAGLVWLLQMEKYLSDRVKHWIKSAMLAAAMLWIGAIGFWWISSVERIPEGDQAFIYGSASYFMEGQYGFLEKGMYCSLFPFNLALIAMTELLFLFVGTYNYYAFQFICVLLSVGIVYMGYRVVQCITDRASVAVFYCLAMMGCLPLAFYTHWVYGDVPGVFCVIWAAWMLLEYQKKEKLRYLVGVVAALTLGVLVRKPAWIAVAAFCIIAAVTAIRHFDKKLLIAAALTVILPMALEQGIYKMYELRSGYEQFDSLPSISLIDMGLSEAYGKYGWYTVRTKDIASELSWDMDAAKEVYKENIKARLRTFAQDPGYAWTFFREKLLSQWNMPLYQSIFFATRYHEDHIPSDDLLAVQIGKEHFTKVLRICDRLQFALYFGMLLYFLLAVKPNSNLLQHFMAVIIIGGFLFSIVWEAKGRYILPYYITMFSLAPVGYYQAVIQVTALFKRDRTRKPDNVAELKKTA